MYTVLNITRLDIIGNKNIDNLDSNHTHFCMETLRYTITIMIYHQTPSEILGA